MKQFYLLLIGFLIVGNLSAYAHEKGKVELSTVVVALSLGAEQPEVSVEAGVLKIAATKTCGQWADSHLSV